MKRTCRRGIVAVTSRLRYLITVRVREGAAVVTLSGDRTDHIVRHGDEFVARVRGTTAVSPLTKEANVEVSARRPLVRRSISSCIVTHP